MVAKVSAGRAAVTGAKSKTRGQVLPGLEWGFRFSEDGAAEELAVDQRLAEHLDGWVWLHFDLADARAAQALRSFSGLTAAAVESLLATDDHQQLQVDDACIYGAFADLVGGIRNSGNSAKKIGFLHFAMTDRLLVSSRRHSVNAADATREALRQGRKIKTVPTLLWAIVEHIVDAVDEYAEDIAGVLDEIEERILADEPSDERLTLGRIRRTIARLHRQLAMSRSLINRFECDVSERSATAPSKLAQRLDWLDGEVVALRDRAHLLQEEVTLKAAEQTNGHLEVLAIVATVFLPPTLVAGIFGMNVKGLPLTEDGYGFLWSMGIIIGASVLVYWLLRRAGTFGK
ncbi:MAG TPA: CorA family divalent cation transporter [Methyloceanibacter sp.]|nr:CorA family divalent cation transporter [Methyloceanibacter sp.]